MSAKVAFLSRPLKNDEDKLFLGVPTNSISGKDGARTVFVIQDGKAHATEVKEGRSWGDITEILSGLKEGDAVALNPNSQLRDGLRVKIKE